MRNQTPSTDQPPTGISPDKPAGVDSSTTLGVNTSVQIFPIQGSAQVKALGPVSQVDPNHRSTTVEDQRGQAQLISSEEMKWLSALFRDARWPVLSPETVVDLCFIPVVSQRADNSDGRKPGMLPFVRDGRTGIRVWVKDVLPRFRHNWPRL
jgi:hypothetical protein